MKLIITIAKLSIMIVGGIIYSLPLMAFSDTVQPRVRFMSTLKRSYGEVSLGGGYNGGVVGYGGGFISKKSSWGVHYFGMLNWYRSKRQPADYIPPRGLYFLGSNYPHDQTSSIAITVAKDFATKNKRLIWVLAAGPCYTNMETTTFQFLVNPGGTNASNYSTSIKESKHLGFVLKASVAYMSKNRFGHQLSILVNTNAKHRYTGIQLDLLWGKLWDHPKLPKKPKVVKLE